MTQAEDKIDVSVCIATYNRLELLGDTIQSVLDQKNLLGLRFEIVISDNHPSGNAEPLVAAIAAKTDIPVRYHQNTTRNFSELRNSSVAQSRGAFIAFIDDDEFADPFWLDELMGAMQRTGADIGVGPRLAIFPDGRKPSYDPSGRSFERHADLEPDALVPLVRADGKPMYGLGTGNSMYRVATCFTDDEPFLRRFGNADGEDMEMLMRLYRQGRTIVWAAKAVVTEVIVAHRLAVNYRFVRARRETKVFALHYTEHSPNPGRIKRLLAAQGLVQLAMGCAITLLTWEFGSKTRIGGRKLIIIGLGKMFWKKSVGWIEEPTFKAISKPKA
jgi:succinoglycan biosynthesis protein ExoM